MSVPISTTVEHVTGDVLDYSIDWTALLASGETVSSSTWTVEAGTCTIGNSLTDGSPSATTKTGTIASPVTTIYLITAASGQTLHLVNAMTTSASRVFNRVIFLSIIAVDAAR